MAQTYILVAAVAYLLGSIPFGYLLVKLFLKQDIRQTGSGNIGATNVARSGKKGLAIATLLLDAGKGALAVLTVARYSISHLGQFHAVLYQEFSVDVPDRYRLYPFFALSALFAILGHCFPVWLKFRGGKGVATGVGVFALLAPKAVLVAVAVFIVVFAISKYVSLGSILAAAVYPVAAYSLYPDYRNVGTSSLMALACCVIIAKHHSNIRRLIAGTENKIGAKKNLIDVERSL